MVSQIPWLMGRRPAWSTLAGFQPAADDPPPRVEAPIAAAIAHAVVIVVVSDIDLEHPPVPNLPIRIPVRTLLLLLPLVLPSHLLAL